MDFSASVSARVGDYRNEDDAAGHTGRVQGGNCCLYHSTGTVGREMLFPEPRAVLVGLEQAHCD